MSSDEPTEQAAAPKDERSDVSVWRISIRTATVLLAFTVIFTALMAATFTATQPMLAASAQSAKLRLIGEVLAADRYDNNLLADGVILPALTELATDAPTTLYRARKNGAAVALVTEAAANDGYSGRITLILAVDASGHLAAVRVTQHKETPGLGDYIDPKRDRNKRNPWINQFNDKGFDVIPADRWRVKKDGGQFDQMSGATISARAVTNATRRTLAWLLPRRDVLFALPSGGTFMETMTNEVKP